MSDAYGWKIGNWVSYKGVPTQFKTQEQIVEFSKDCKEMKLTPEMLQNYGFSKKTKMKDVFDSYKDSYNVEVIFNHTHWLLGSVIVDHVHALQNAYFSLTGRALEPNP